MGRGVSNVHRRRGTAALHVLRSLLFWRAGVLDRRAEVDVAVPATLSTGRAGKAHDAAGTSASTGSTKWEE
jgi:hypothetical protein